MKHLITCFPKLWITLVITAIIMLAGCASAPSPSSTATTSPPITASPTPTETVTPTGSPSATPSPTASPSPTPTVVLPKVVIISPLYNVTIPPGDIKVSVQVTNFNIVDKIGQPNVPGEGHLIYYKDVTPPTNPGSRATTAPGSYFETAANSYTWTGVTEGNHTFAVQLVNNDGTPLTPAITASEPVPVVSPTPTPSPSASPSATP